MLIEEFVPVSYSMNFVSHCNKPRNLLLQLGCVGICKSLTYVHYYDLLVFTVTPNSVATRKCIEFFSA